MKLQQLQNLIDQGQTLEEMMCIAEAYLGKGPIRDPTAAQAWLMRVIEAEDPIRSPQAMVLLAREILHTAPVFSEDDLTDIRAHLNMEKDPEKSQLQYLLKLAESNGNTY